MTENNVIEKLFLGNEHILRLFDMLFFFWHLSLSILLMTVNNSVLTITVEVV